MILKTKTRWSLGLLQMMGMGRRCARVCVTWDRKRDVLPWAFVLETDVGVVNLSGWMDGWMDGWINGWSKILTVLLVMRIGYRVLECREVDRGWDAWG
jgi:hypothetical protein